MQNGYYYKNVQAGTNPYNTQCGDIITDEINYITEEYAQATEYAVHGWVKSELSCDGVSTIFRLVIDLPTETTTEYVNPNWDDFGDFQVYDGELGYNVLVGSISDG